MTALPETSAPAERALVAAGYDSLESLAGVSIADLMPLHGSDRSPSTASRPLSPRPDSPHWSDPSERCRHRSA